MEEYIKRRLRKNPLQEAYFDSKDFYKHAYLDDFVNDILSGKEIETKSGGFKFNREFVNDEEKENFRQDLLSIKTDNLPMDVSRDKFEKLVGIKWSTINKAPYSGKGGGIRNFKSFNATFMNESIQILLLTGLITSDDINIDTLSSYLALDKEVDPIEWETFIENWQFAFKYSEAGKVQFQTLLKDMGFDVSTLIPLHAYIDNEFIEYSKILSSYSDAVIDKSDFYLWNGEGGKEFLEEFVSKRKAKKGFAAYAEELVNEHKIVGISLKKPVGTLHVEYDPTIPLDFFTGEVYWGVAETEKAIKSNYINFKTNSGEFNIILTVRPNGEGSCRTEFRPNIGINRLNGPAFGSATTSIKKVFPEFSKYMHNKNSLQPCEEASEFLLQCLGIPTPQKNIIQKLSPEGIHLITMFFMEAAGYGSINPDGSRKTAPYIKVY